MPTPAQQYQAYKNTEIKVVESTALSKRSVSIMTEGEAKQAKENICFVYDGGDSKVGFAHRLPDGEIVRLDITLPPARVLFSNMGGLGGRPLVQGKPGPTRKFSAVVTNAPLIHKNFEEKNKSMRRKETLDAFYDLMEEYNLQFMILKTRRPSIHSDTYQSLFTNVSKHLTKEELANKEFVAEKMFIAMSDVFNSSIEKDSADTDRVCPPNSGGVLFKISKSDFIDANPKIALKDIDPGVMAIYKAGKTENNVHYEFAKEVVDNYNLPVKKLFTVHNITYREKDHETGKPKTYKVFDDGFGSDSTVSIRFTLGAYSASKFDGINAYFTSAVVIKEEKGSGYGAPTVCNYADADDEEEAHTDKKARIEEDDE